MQASKTSDVPGTHVKQADQLLPVAEWDVLKHARGVAARHFVVGRLRRFSC
jgi:predicted GTPase